VQQPTDRALIVEEFAQALYPAGSLSLTTAWLGIYQLLWWYEHGLLHVREANDLLRSKTWQDRARAAEAYITQQLGVPRNQLPQLVDRMIRLPRWSPGGMPVQRQNPLGRGFRVLVGEVLTRWGDPRFDYREEEFAAAWFPGMSLPGRSRNPRMDVLAVEIARKRPAAILSCKWSIRHDRISEPTNECTAYKGAAIQQQIMNLRYYVITNEMDGQRLDKVLDQPCVDGLVHVHLGLVRYVLGSLTAAMNAAITARRLFDLSDFVDLTRRW
jgi:hypothetical protein